ncbi:MAG: hypothetical protein RL150_459 [Candidatus Parcubacteria bacterium]|jgi:hypothetical protein
MKIKSPKILRIVLVVLIVLITFLYLQTDVFVNDRKDTNHVVTEVGKEDTSLKDGDAQVPEKSKTTSTKETLNRFAEDLDLFKGKQLGGMSVVSFSAFNQDFSNMYSQNVRIFLKGPIQVTGTYGYVQTEEGFHGYCMSDFTNDSLALLPYLPLIQKEVVPRSWFCFRNEDESVVVNALGKEERIITVLIDNYELISYPTTVVDRADLVEVVLE